VFYLGMGLYEIHARHTIARVLLAGRVHRTRIREQVRVLYIQCQSTGTSTNFDVAQEGLKSALGGDTDHQYTILDSR